MASVEIAAVAVGNLDDLVSTLSLPADTRSRVAASLRPLERFPRFGSQLTGRWDGYRIVLGPWRWMLLAYEYDEQADRVVVVTIQDARASQPATGGP